MFLDRRLLVEPFHYLNDNDDIMKQMLCLYGRANSFLRTFDACSFEVQPVSSVLLKFILCPSVV